MTKEPEVIYLLDKTSLKDKIAGFKGNPQNGCNITIISNDKPTDGKRTDRLKNIREVVL